MMILFICFVVFEIVYKYQVHTNLIISSTRLDTCINTSILNKIYTYVIVTASEFKVQNGYYKGNLLFFLFVCHLMVFEKK
jgi:hypothetical protein